MKLHERLHFIQASRLAPSRKHLVSVIAGFLGDDDNGPAFPSVATMAKLTSMSEAQIHNLLREMVAESLIIREDGGRRALFTRIRWEAIKAHTPAASGRGGARAKTPKTAPQAPKTAPIDDAAPLDEGSKDWCHEGPVFGGEGAKTGAMGAKTAPDQIMISPEIRPEDQTRDARDLPPDPTLLTILLQTTRSHMHQLIADDIRRRLTGSRPTTGTDQIDNDGDKTPSPKSAPPPSPSTDGAAPATTPTTAPPAQARREVAPGAEAAQAGASTLAPPAKKGKPKKGKPDDAAILAIAAQVDRMMGRPGAALPGSGRWKLLITAANEAGADRVLARVTAMADAAQGLPSPASAIYAQMAPSNYGTDPILRGNNGWTIKLDDAIDAARAAGSRSDASGDAGGITSRVQAREGSQVAKTPNQNGSAAWDDMLAVIRSTGGLRLSLGLRGSTLSHDADEHARRCRAVVDIGGWAKLCEMGDGNRGIIRAQFVAAYDRAGVAA